MSLRLAALAACAVVGTLLSCTSVVDPHRAIELRTEIAPALVSVGDTVTIRAILRNPTSRSIEAGRACGPPVLFELRNRGGEIVHPIPLDGASICPYLDYHLIEPGETDTVLTRWRVELTSGEWSVRGGFRNGHTLAPLSPAVSLTVE